MSELSPQGQALLRATRAALRPQLSDKERVLASLRDRLGTPAAGAATKAAAVHASRTVWTIAGAAFVGVGGVVALGLSSLSTPAKAPALAPAVSAVPVATVALAAPVLPEATPAPTPAVAATPSVLTRRDRLAEEVAILSQAAKDLRAGHAANALSALNEHQKKFPSGLLTQERRAARAEALCSLGRFAEADAELSTLVRTAPQSPLTVRAQQRCKARPDKAR
jgi:hypothetical protein